MKRGVAPILRSILCSASLLALAACGDTDTADDLTVKNKPPETLYREARAMFAEKKFKEAVPLFEEVERQHPYSPWAPRGEIMAAYSAYRAGQYDDAISLLDRFASLHPTHASIAYAYYLKALCYYNQITDVGRDQEATEKARSALNDVVQRFKDTNYARDAKLKLDLTNDHLAGKEMEIGRYYLKQQEYIAAIGRFRKVVETYQTTSHIPEALHRLVEAYLRLGVVDQAKRYAAVLGYNYPGSEWYRYSYAMMEGNLSPEERKGRFGHWLSSSKE
jgi:outer membrane protein assembly factor BamD